MSTLVMETIEKISSGDSEERKNPQKMGRNNLKEEKSSSIKSNGFLNVNYAEEAKSTLSIPLRKKKTRVLSFSSIDQNYRKGK